MYWKSLVVSILLFNCLVKCFWPPPYSIHLNHEETFVFLTDMEEFENDEEEMEMLKENDICGLRLEVDDYQMDMLHKHFIHNNTTPEPEDHVHYSDVDYLNEEGTIKKRRLEPVVPIPYSSLLIVNGNTIEKRTLQNELTGLTDNATEVTNTSEINANANDNESGINNMDADYDYVQLKAEYDMELSKPDKATYNYTDTDKPEDTIKDSFNNLIDFKKPRNCTKEEAENFGIKAVECLVDEYGHVTTKKSKTELFWKGVKIFKIWLIIYFIIAIPLYCKYGWCCCCFCCWSLCRPKQIILNSKAYVAKNPPGVLIQSNGKVLNYKPTEYEIEAYEDLLQYTRRL